MTMHPQGDIRQSALTSRLPAVISVTSFTQRFVRLLCDSLIRFLSIQRHEIRIPTIDWVIKGLAV